jgi:hypothetical protein
MDAGYLKIKIDIISEYSDYKKKYSYKRKEFKKDEIKKVYDGFKDFFKNDGNFKFKENEHSITAEYKDYGIILEMDVYKNTDNPNFDLEGTIKTFDKEVYEIVVEAVPNKEIPLQPAHVSEQERMIHDTRYFQDYLNDEISYTYQYRIKGREGIYSSMQELMFAL